MLKIGRRHLLALGAALGSAVLTGTGGRTVLAAFGQSTQFGFALLRKRAEELAKQPYKKPEPPAPKQTSKIDFDVQQKISFRPDRAVWRNAPDRFPVRFFHLHKFAPLPVRIHIVSNGMAREFLYSPDMFNYGDTGLGQSLPPDLGFAGFRVMDGPNETTDWLAFQGASYFRCAGEENQYGISARGIAANTATETTEEFPIFTEFWLQANPGGETDISIYALLDGPSLTGAYRFDVQREKGAVMDVHAELFFRADVSRLGIAPLTSMYWFGENQRRTAADWRPEIHDSDGLAMWTGSHERIFRPLVNPPSVQVNSFQDKNPRGFGLVQRDRDFENYQDDSAFYERRPSVWVEPKGDWGAGAVQLVEIPTDDEIYDNIVAFWRPDEEIEKGNTLAVDYRLYWRNHAPVPRDSIGRVVATRIGRGGIPGQPRPDDDSERKFVIDFQGGPLEGMEARFDVTPVVTVSRGKVKNAYVIKVVGTGRWRAAFDITIDGTDPIDLRCFLRLDDKSLTETWLYQYFPRS